MFHGEKLYGVLSLFSMDEVKNRDLLERQHTVKRRNTDVILLTRKWLQASKSIFPQTRTLPNTLLVNLGDIITNSSKCVESELRTLQEKMSKTTNFFVSTSQISWLFCL